MFVLLGVARQSLFQLSCIKAFALTLYPLLCETGSHFVALAGLEFTELCLPLPLPPECICQDTQLHLHFCLMVLGLRDRVLLGTQVCLEDALMPQLEAASMSTRPSPAL